ncbi:hypothetical protein PR048_029669 [Dryococelus australis]|uniref:Chitin-binding type-2 domain-containing protein n=1 Tax=Dryococelus australis TaxID=614101 RepID=A0ABQ9GGG5_9NEOP|nr:hypothetical protein PR048_029669 [Dryococelus australis]
MWVIGVKYVVALEYKCGENGRFARYDTIPKFETPGVTRCRGGVVVRPLVSQLGEPGSIPGWAAPGFLNVWWESRRTTQLVGGFSRSSRVFPALAIRRRSILISLHSYCLELSSPGSLSVDKETSKYICLVPTSWYETRSEFGSNIDTENGCNIRVQSWTGDRDEVHFEPPKVVVRNLDPRSAAIWAYPYSDWLREALDADCASDWLPYASRDSLMVGLLACEYADLRTSCQHFIGREPFAVVAVLLVAYARADVTDLTDAQLDALSADQTKAITDEQWGIIFNRRCNPIFASYAKSQYLPDRRNCHYFYECVGVHAVRMECAANLYWNARLNTCDYPYHAGCIYGSGASPIQGLPIQGQPSHHLPIQPAYPIQGSSGSSSSQINDDGAIEIPIGDSPIVVDPYKHGTVVRLLASYQYEPGSIPGGDVVKFSHVGIVPYDAAGRRVSSGISLFLHPFITALLHTHLASPSSAPKTSMLKATLISSLTGLELKPLFIRHVGELLEESAATVLNEAGPSGIYRHLASPIAADRPCDVVSERDLDWSSDSDFEDWPSNRLTALAHNTGHLFQ